MKNPCLAFCAMCTGVSEISGESKAFSAVSNAVFQL